MNHNRYVVSEQRWMDQANCKDDDTNIFFDEATEHMARLICSQCVVRPDCLNYAMKVLDRDTVGVFAGTNEKDRRRLRRKQRVA